MLTGNKVMNTMRAEENRRRINLISLVNNIGLGMHASIYEWGLGKAC